MIETRSPVNNSERRRLATAEWPIRVTWPWSCGGRDVTEAAARSTTAHRITSLEDYRAECTIITSPEVKVKVHTLDIAPLRSESPLQKRSGMARVLKGFQFYLHTHTFIRNRNEPYLPLPSQL